MRRGLSFPTAAMNGIRRPRLPPDSAVVWRAARQRHGEAAAGTPICGGLSFAIDILESTAAPAGVLPRRRCAHGRLGDRHLGGRRIGSSAKRSTCSASCSRVIRTCAACSPTTASSAIRFARTFPLSGNVEVRYDPEKSRVVYQPVTIDPRVLVPKVIRHDNRYDPALTNAPVQTTSLAKSDG